MGGCTGLRRRDQGGAAAFAADGSMANQPSVPTPGRGHLFQGPVSLEEAQPVARDEQWLYLHFTDA